MARAALIFALIAASLLIGSARTRAGGSGFTDIKTLTGSDFEVVDTTGFANG